MFNYDDLNDEKKKKEFNTEETLEGILERYEMAIKSDVIHFSDVVS